MADSARHPAWKWAVCLMLLLATMLNYMDRLTVAQLSGEIIREFEWTDKEKETKYGALDAAFAVAFALGALGAGWMVDRWNVWWIYPTALAAWSLAGGLTGFVPVGAFVPLLLCRFFLGLTEAGHWPCALRTTQRILPPEQRTLGNSILQSGAAIGSVVTPLMCLAILRATGSWRYPFMIIGSLGIFWVVLWFSFLRPRDLSLANMPTQPEDGEKLGSLWEVLGERRFWILVVVVFSINSTWHFFRVWLPRLLDRTHGFSTEDIQYFSVAYYVSADVGSLAAGFGTVWLVRRGFSVHGSRLCVFIGCACLTTLSVVVIFLPRGPMLWGVMMVIGFAALGLFPPFYSFSQELTVKHQGKVTGLFGFLSWITMAPLRLVEGYITDQTGTFAYGLALAGVMPVLGSLALVWFWPRSNKGLNHQNTKSTE